MTTIICTRCDGTGFVESKEDDLTLCPDCEGSGKFCSICKEPIEYCSCYADYDDVRVRKINSKRGFKE